jgi:predicted dehydrogenase
MPGRPFVHGFTIYLEQATLVYDSSGSPFTLVTADGNASALPETASAGDPLQAFAEELQFVVDGVAAGREPRLLSGQLALEALILCQRECESVKTGRVVDV